MADVNITYKGTSIATMDASGAKTLTTQGKYCEGDISVAYTKPSGKETLSWHQCPEAVRNYFAAASAAYPSNDNVTVIDQYAPSRGNEVIANTKPVGYTIDGVTFRDNEPLVATPFATANKAGTLTALDRLRWYNTTPTGAAAGSVYPRGRNCRDLGGWSCDGGTVRYGMLIRGSEPNPDDKELMVNKIGVKTEVQILPVSEQPTDYKMKSPWGIDWAGNDTNDNFYDGLNNKPLWKKILTAIMDSVNHCKPVYFHCGVGADRTGIVAMCLLAILGVAKSDIDQDYELTNFDTGWQSLDGGIFRSRTYSSQVALNNAINDVTLANGLTDSYRNRWVSFALSCGISIDKINAFRAACIDGTPDEITAIVPTYTISKSGANVTFDNQITSVNEYDSYSVGVTPNSDYVISDVSVTMGGTDITSQVFSGTPTVRRVSVANNLVNCSTSNSANVVDEGTSFAATITADEGYTLDGATVQITMGGVNVSQYYSNGTINIPSVAGNVVISVTAVESAPAYTNLADPADPYWKDGYRLSISGGGTSAMAGHTTTNFIPAKPGDVIRVKGMKLTSAESSTGSNCKIVVYTTKDVESSHVDGLYGITSTQKRHAYANKVTVSGDVSAYTLLYDNNGTQTSATNMQYFRIDGMLLSGYTSADVVITINEEIV